MEKFTNPTMEIIEIKSNDVIATSDLELNDRELEEDVF